MKPETRRRVMLGCQPPRGKPREKKLTVVSKPLRVVLDQIADL